jgi:hypothetical protein
MKTVQLSINDGDPDRIVNYLIGHLLFDAENHTKANESRA